MKKFIFRDENTGKAYVIPLLNGFNPDEETVLDLIHEEINRRDLEASYGIHDWSSHPGSGELIGFSTYEVETDAQWTKLIDEWKEILQQVGFQIGTLQVVEPAEEMED